MGEIAFPGIPNSDEGEGSRQAPRSVSVIGSNRERLAARKSAPRKFKVKSHKTSSTLSLPKSAGRLSGQKSDVDMKEERGEGDLDEDEEVVPLLRRRFCMMRATTRGANR